MRLILRLCIIFLVLLQFTSCNKRNKSSDNNIKYSISIVFDSSYNSKVFYRMTDLITGSDTISKDTTIWNKLIDETTIKWKNLKPGLYHISFQTVRHNPIVKDIKLESDTVIQIWKEFNYQFVNLISKEQLLDADTIDYVFGDCGTCSAQFRKYMLVRDNKKYHLFGSRGLLDSIDREVSPKIIDDLYNLQYDCRNYKSKEVKGFGSNIFMLIAGKKAFYYDDKVTGADIFIDPFISKY